MGSRGGVLEQTSNSNLHHPLTIALLRFPRASILVRANQLSLLIFHQSVRFHVPNKNVLGGYSTPTLTTTCLPASIFVPRVDGMTWEFLQTHPHFAAVTAWIREALPAYVVNRVDNRLRNEAVDDCLHSDVEGRVTESGVAVILEP